MKTKPTNDFLSELSEEEYIIINGGESGWYWIAYGAGVVARESKEFIIDAYVFIQYHRPAI